MKDYKQKEESNVIREEVSSLPSLSDWLLMIVADEDDLLFLVVHISFNYSSEIKCAERS